jgi:tetratricopeptide (TPR) repeat protein
MKHLFTLGLGVLLAHTALADVNFIDATKISGKNHAADLAFLRTNKEYFDHWTQHWEYGKSRQELRLELRGCYQRYAALPVNNQELDLLLGDIAQYLYNLEEESYYDKAVSHYERAAKASPQDYRSYWFLGSHYALSNRPDLSVGTFDKARQRLPAKPPGEFWEAYAWAAAAAGMPAHALFALDKARVLLGGSSGLEPVIGQPIRDKTIPADKTQSYPNTELWSAEPTGRLLAFTSRPLGVRLLVDSTWQLQVGGYNAGQSSFLIKPPAVRSAKGNQIGYSIALLTKAPAAEEQLSGYLQQLVGRYADKKQIGFSTRYENLVAYEIRDQAMYPKAGGAHLYVIGLERTAPQYPGLLLEAPAVLPAAADQQVHYYRHSGGLGRFEGRMFYALLLDTCEEIHPQALAQFKALFDRQLVIE